MQGHGGASPHRASQLLHRPWLNQLRLGRCRPRSTSKARQTCFRLHAAPSCPAPAMLAATCQNGRMPRREARYNAWAPMSRNSDRDTMPERRAWNRCSPSPSSTKCNPRARAHAVRLPTECRETWPFLGAMYHHEASADAGRSSVEKSMAPSGASAARAARNVPRGSRLCSTTSNIVTKS